jgi:hypothetical protein
MNVTKGRCRLCIQTCNVDWSIDDELWDKVMNDESGTLRMKYGGCICMTCFAKLAIKTGMSPDRWRLSLDPDPEDTSWANQVIFRYYGDHRDDIFLQSYTQDREWWKATWRRVSKEMRENYQKIVDERERQILTQDKDGK